MKTISTLLAALAAASTLFAVPVVQAADNQERVNPHAALPFYGYDHIRETGAAVPAPAAVKAVSGATEQRINPHAALPFYGYDHQR